MSTGHETANAATLGLSRTAESLGLPAGIRACLFDLDGVLIQTAQLHAAAWKETFDNFLRDRSVRTARAVRPVRLRTRLRAIRRRQGRQDGVREFLAARGIEVPRRRDRQHVRLGRKNELVLELIRRRGSRPYEGSVRYVRAVQDAGLAPRGRLGQRELPCRPRGGGTDRPVRGADRRGVVAERKSISWGSLLRTPFSRRRARSGVEAGRSGGLRGRARGRRRRPRGPLRFRRRRRSGRPRPTRFASRC